MADLVTHACTALLPGAFLPARHLPLVTFGTVLPDLLGRVVPMVLAPLGHAAGLPELVIWPWNGLHEPAGWLLVSAVLSFAFVEKERAKALLALITGCALHLGLDVLQDHHGEGYVLLAPFSTAKLELGLIGSEATVDVALPLLAVTAAAWAARFGLWRRMRRSSGRTSLSGTRSTRAPFRSADGTCRTACHRRAGPRR